MGKSAKGLRVQRSAEQWRVLLSGFAGSGLSVAEFCAREGISDSSFHRWRGRLQAVASRRDEGAAACGFLDAGVLRRESRSASRLELSLDLGGGVQLPLIRG